MKSLMFRVVLSQLLLWAIAAAPLRAAEHKLDLCGTIALPGVEGRLDHFAIDSKGQRLFLAALDNNSLEIVGLRELRRLQTITGMRKPTGVAYLPNRNLVCVANSEDGTLRIHDAGTYQPKQIIHGLENADNLRYDPHTELVYAGYGKGGIGIVNASGGEVVAMVKLQAHPESFQIESSKRTLFVNIPDAKQIAVVDLKERKLVGSWSVERFPLVFPMALDEPNHRLFSACRRPARLLVLDTQSGRILAEVPIAADADDLYYDARRKRIYVSCGEGFVDVIEQIDPDQYRPLEKIPTAVGARTSLFSSELDVLAVAVPRRGQQQGEVRLYQPH